MIFVGFGIIDEPIVTLRTKGTISVSPGATCSVESLKDGVDYTGSINRMRLRIVVNAVYLAVASAVSTLLASAGVDVYNIDEIIDRLYGWNNVFTWSRRLYLIQQRFWLVDPLSKPRLSRLSTMGRLGYERLSLVRRR